MISLILFQLPEILLRRDKNLQIFLSLSLVSLEYSPAVIVNPANKRENEDL